MDKEEEKLLKKILPNRYESADAYNIRLNGSGVLRKVNEYFIGSKDNHLYRANFRDIPECWTFVAAIPKNTIGKPNLHLVQENGIEGVTIDLAIESDNTGVKSMKIKYPED